MLKNKKLCVEERTWKKPKKSSKRSVFIWYFVLSGLIKKPAAETRKRYLSGESGDVDPTGSLATRLENVFCLSGKMEL
jgi:hypothetical protein